MLPPCLFFRGCSFDCREYVLFFSSTARHTQWAFGALRWCSLGPHNVCSWWGVEWRSSLCAMHWPHWSSSCRGTYTWIQVRWHCENSNFTFGTLPTSRWWILIFEEINALPSVMKFCVQYDTGWSRWNSKNASCALVPEWSSRIWTRDMMCSV